MKTFLNKSASSCISGLTLTTENYGEAVRILEERFSNTQILTNAFKNSPLRILFDSVSHRTFLNENIRELVNIKSISKEKLLINTFSEKSSFLREFDIVKIKLKGIRDFIIEAVCISSVCTPHSNQQCNKVVHVFPHFRNLKYAGNINEQNKKIDFLIGANYYHKFFTEEVIRGKEGEPVAQNTFFGWVLSGNISNL